jgi:hypothetical protein
MVGAKMISNVKVNVPTQEVAAFCQQWQIVEFALFGSVLNPTFHAQSDIDVLVSFAPGVIYTLLDLDTMQAELETIFGRAVDLVHKKAIEESPNYIRRREILDSAQVIYQANYA